MPTASRLIAALCLAGLAWLVSDMIKPLFEEGKDFGNFNLINLVIGALTGWQVVGSRAGRGYAAGFSNGLTGGIVLVFWGLLIHSAVRMFEISMRGRYDGFFDAFGAAVEIMGDNALLIATPAILGTLFAGSILSGLLAEFVNRQSE